MEQISLYLDEHIQLALTEALKARGVDVLTTQEAGNVGLGDVEQLSKEEISFIGPKPEDPMTVQRKMTNEDVTLQNFTHRRRSEHWVVAEGIAKVTKESETYLIHTNESTYIPINTKHRLENPGDVPLQIIEVQNGDYVEEDDIVRFDDDYGRLDL